MSEELPIIVPVHTFHREEVVVAMPETPVAAHPPEMVKPEQAKAVDAFFEHDKEHVAVAQFLALYGGSMLLADLAQGHLPAPEDAESEDDDPPQK